MKTDCPCPICESLSTSTYGERYDDRYGYQNAFRLLKCANCEHIFLHADFTTEQLRDLYSNYYPRKNFDIAQYQPHIEKTGLAAWLNGLKSSAFRWVPKNVRILDVGCGFGESLGYHSARGCDVYGVEADENIRRVVDKFGFKVHVGLFDEKVYESNFFDYVTMDQVFEHVQNPIEVLKDVARVLKPGGLAILSVPNAAGWGAKLFGRLWINWHAPYHLQFFSVHSMQLAAETTGFSLDKTITVTASDWLHYQWIHLLTYPNEGNPSEFWTQKGRFSLTQKIAIKILTMLHSSKVDHLITRIFDSLGMGDNRLFFLHRR